MQFSYQTCADIARNHASQAVDVAVLLGDRAELSSNILSRVRYRDIRHPHLQKTVLEMSATFYGVSNKVML